MRLVFWANGSPAIGAGHIMRSSAVAEEAISRGIESIFVGNLASIDWVEKRIRGLGFKEVFNTSDVRDLDGQDCLFLDTYDRKVSQVAYESNKWKKIILMLDRHTPASQADLTIHPGLDASWAEGIQGKFLYGPSFIPFRRSIHKRDFTDFTDFPNILVFGGGTDPHDFALEMASHLRNIDCIRQVIFISNKSSEIEKLDSRFRVEAFGETLDLQLESTDLVFTTASTSSLEILARGIPFGIACAVDNQIDYYQKLKESGYAIGIGERTKSGSWVLDRLSIEQLVCDPESRKSIVEKSSGMVDTLGSKRIVDEIIKLCRK